MIERRGKKGLQSRLRKARVDAGVIRCDRQAASAAVQHLPLDEDAVENVVVRVAKDRVRARRSGEQQQQNERTGEHLERRKSGVDGEAGGRRNRVTPNRRATRLLYPHANSAMQSSSLLQLPLLLTRKLLSASRLPISACFKHRPCAHRQLLVSSSSKGSSLCSDSSCNCIALT